MLSERGIEHAVCAFVSLLCFLFFLGGISHMVENQKQISTQPEKECIENVR